MPASEDALDLLRKINANLTQILGVLVATQGVNTMGAGQNGRTATTDADLDSTHGNPEVKAKDPRDWTGPPMRGRKFSECPADYLDMLADRYDYFASKEDDPNKAKYNRLDAARARGWADRVRAGRVSWNDDTPVGDFGSFGEPVDDFQ